MGESFVRSVEFMAPTELGQMVVVLQPLRWREKILFVLCLDNTRLEIVLSEYQGPRGGLRKIVRVRESRQMLLFA